MKQTTVLSAEARELIERAHPEPGPSDAACRRMELELAPLFAAGPGSLLLAPSLQRLAEPKLGLGPAALGVWQRGGATWGSAWGKLSVGAVSVALMVGAFWLGRTTSKPAEGLATTPAAPVSTSVAAPSPVPPNRGASDLASLDTAAASPLPSNAALPSAAGLLAPRPVAARRTARAVDGLTLLGEVELSLREGHPRTALRELRGLDAAAPPRLQHLARVLRAVALCDAGRLDEGRHLVAEIEDRRTNSVFAARLERACSAPAEGVH